MADRRKSSVFEGHTAANGGDSGTNSGKLPSLTPTSKSLGSGWAQAKRATLGGANQSMKSKFAKTQEHRKPETLKTPLQPSELQMAEEVWNSQVHGGFVTSLPALTSLLYSLQIPQQPIITNLVKEKFAERSHFSYQDFLFLLEQCKTIHIRWLHKIQGKALDDDLLEAFVAVGGEEDSGGEVDLSQMQHVIDEFHLSVDLNGIAGASSGGVVNASSLHESTNPVNKPKEQQQPKPNLHFNGFAKLLKEQRKPGAGVGHLPPIGSPHRPKVDEDAYLMEDDVGGGVDDALDDNNGTTTTVEPPLLSTHEFFEDDVEVGADGIVRHRPAPVPDPMNNSLPGMNRHKSGYFGSSPSFVAEGGRLNRQSSNLGGALQRNSTMVAQTPEPTSLANASTNVGGTGGGSKSKRSKQFGGMDRQSPPRSRSTEPGASSPSSKLQPIRQMKKGPKKPKYANW